MRKWIKRAENSAQERVQPRNWPSAIKVATRGPWDLSLSGEIFIVAEHVAENKERPPIYNTLPYSSSGIGRAVILFRYNSSFSIISAKVE